MLIHSDVRPTTRTPPAPPDPCPPAVEHPASLPVFALLPVLLIIAVKIAINMAVASRYGWHRDELYYADAGRHLSLGYVDFPPITAWLARLGSLLFGRSLAGLRLLAVLAGAGVVMITALITRDLGGRRWAQILAALAIAPLTLGSNAMFQTVSFDQLAWAFVLWAAVRVLRHGGTRTWVILGAAIGVAWMTKFTVGMLVVGLVIGLVSTRSGRSRLHGRGPWLGVLIALAIAAPNIWWQVRHGWPSIDFFTSRSDGTRADNPPTKFGMELVLGAGVAALPVWVTGVRHLLADRRLRVIGIAVLTVLLGWVAAGGKAYYAAPVLIVAFAAGAVHLEARMGQTAARSTDRRVAGRGGRLLPACIIATSVLASPLILPVVSTSQMVDLGLWHARDDYAEELGWPELVKTVSHAWHAQPRAARSSTAIVAGNYGEAGAIDRWGPALGLPPVVSGHLSHRYWTPSARTMAATDAILVGFDSHDAHELCRTAKVVARIANRAGVDNEEAGGAVWRCVVRGSIGDRWSWLAAS